MPPGSTSTKAPATVFDALKLFESAIQTSPPEVLTDSTSYSLKVNGLGDFSTLFKIASSSSLLGNSP